ncbi:rRNA 2'-O-methyltransferase fibrillarin-like [Iris pallida]|uniref:rRNA 2'-O-methyltransferase fibrillarin-like n=1 Tax=Iris pallida TaxID=29817 RepID=A0AAX6GV24_IRIPA|nr:rRNA 2'-O-methyltransferase fibrillarin-like [Iris pallida]
MSSSAWQRAHRGRLIGTGAVAEAWSGSGPSWRSMHNIYQLLQQEPSIQAIISRVIQNGDQDEIRRSFYLMWAIWKGRNKTIF